MIIVLQLCPINKNIMKTEKLKNRNTTEKDDFTLLNGMFSPSEASDIITHLIHEKINFLKIRSLGQYIRSGSEDEWSLARIEELRHSKEAIRELLDEAKNQGKSLSIQANISIELI